MSSQPAHFKTIDGVAWTLALRYQRARLPAAKQALRARILAIGANPDKFSVSQTNKTK
jgi:hypothetical protein